MKIAWNSTKLFNVVYYMTPLILTVRSNLSSAREDDLNLKLSPDLDTVIVDE